MNYQVIRSRRKTLSIQVDERARVIVRAPHYASDAHIEKIVAQKRDWIEKNLRHIQSKISQHRPKVYQTGERFLFLGVEYPLFITDTASIVDLQEDHIIFPRRFQHQPHEHMMAWYQREAAHYIGNRTEELAGKLGIQYNKLNISKAHKRWGSCSAKGNINFSYRLMMATPFVIDYVIVHELIHRIHMNHSKEFWEMVAQYIPDYKVAKRYLKDHNLQMRIE